MKKDRIIGALAVICAFAVTVMAVALSKGQGGRMFTPPPFEQAAQPGVPEAPGYAAYRQMDVSAFRVGLCGEVRIRNGSAEVWFANPQENTVWLKLRLLDREGRILGESGILVPGTYVKQIDAAGLVPGAQVVLKVMAYEPETYHSAGSLTFQTVAFAE